MHCQVQTCTLSPVTSRVIKKRFVVEPYKSYFGSRQGVISKSIRTYKRTEKKRKEKQDVIKKISCHFKRSREAEGAIKRIIQISQLRPN